MYGLKYWGRKRDTEGQWMGGEMLSGGLNVYLVFCGYCFLSVQVFLSKPPFQLPVHCPPFPLSVKLIAEGHVTALHFVAITNDALGKNLYLPRGRAPLKSMLLIV